MTMVHRVLKVHGVLAAVHWRACSRRRRHWRLSGRRVAAWRRAGSGRSCVSPGGNPTHARWLHADSGAGDAAAVATSSFRASCRGSVRCRTRAGARRASVSDAPGASPHDRRRPLAVDEATIRERLKALDDLESRARYGDPAAAHCHRSGLNPYQQARFRLFEEMMEQRKIELLMRARQGRGRQNQPQTNEEPRNSGTGGAEELSELRQRADGVGTLSLMSGRWLRCRPSGLLLTSTAVRRCRIQSSRGGTRMPSRSRSRRSLAAAGRRPQGLNGPARPSPNPKSTGTWRSNLATICPPVSSQPAVVMLGQGRASGQAVVDLDRVRQGIGATSVLESPQLSPGPAAGRRNRHARKPATASHVPVRIGHGRRRADPEARASADRQLLLAVRDVPSGISLDDPFALPAAHPRDSGRARSGDCHPIERRALSLIRLRLKIGGSRLRSAHARSEIDRNSALRRPPRDAAAVPEGRRPAARGRSRARRPRTPSKICCTGFRSATKTAAASSRSPRSSRARRASIAGTVLSCGLRSTRRPGFKIFEALVGDASGALRATWLNQPFLRDVFARGQQRRAVRRRSRCAASGGLQLTNPQYEILDDEDGETIHTGRIVPVYEKTGSVTPKIQRRLVLRRAAAAARRICPIRCRRRCGCACSLPARHAALAGGAFSAGGRCRSTS